MRINKPVGDEAVELLHCETTLVLVACHGTGENAAVITNLHSFSVLILAERSTNGSKPINKYLMSKLDRQIMIVSPHKLDGCEAGHGSEGRYPLHPDAVSRLVSAMNNTPVPVCSYLASQCVYPARKRSAIDIGDAARM
ncbi:hypothetical protein DOTSEDRAFT_33525 [Dothistroma septosporum NZE10]|uniref:Uncharacterized protein n=1 Tax=Dothistroma septosporum (strain NZE10 / CBS 128990) TaxID=675120 RepID=N1PPN8_DOTSN|nr:hypothetical protein DOTSEDRAFT_33525 [Dothistroma septosporum NZE10]